VRSRRRARSFSEPESSVAAAQAAAFDDARALALEMGRGVPALHFDATRAGLVLGRSETAYRWVGAWIAAQDGRCWAPPNWAQALITDERLLCRCDDGRLLSLPWADVTGLQIGLDQQCIVINYGGEPPIAFRGAETVVLAVAAVAGTYGLQSLLTHPGLSPLRDN
jgi:hypothetical protein